jgi:hypothetical protein
MKRDEILSASTAITMGDRNRIYGSPVSNMEQTARLFRAYLVGKFGLNEECFQLSGEDVAQLLILVKMARSFRDAKYVDNYVDMTAYAAIAGECAFYLQETRENLVDAMKNPNEIMKDIPYKYVNKTPSPFKETE